MSFTYHSKKVREGSKYQRSEEVQYHFHISTIWFDFFQEKSHGYLVDPASSHMLVSKIKPCMSKNKPSNGESANGSLNQLLFL